MYWESFGPHRFKFNAVIHFCGRNFYKSNTKSRQYKHLRVKHIGQLMKTVIFILVLMFLSYGIAFVTPIYMCLFKHRRVTPLAINLPMLENESDLEFTLNMSLQMVISFYSLSGSFPTEVASCTIIHAIMLVPDLIRFNLVKFQNELVINGIKWKSVVHLRNTFIQLQDYNWFETNLTFFI